MPTALVTLLRNLAGRLPDDDLAALRNSLAARELEDLERSLLFDLADNAIGLTSDERALLTAAGLHADSPIIADLPPATVPEITFRPESTQDSTDQPLVAAAKTLAALREVRKSRRVVAGNPDEAGTPDKTVYVVKLAEDADVATAQGALQWGLGPALVEVIADGENLPPYQRDAWEAGTVVFARADPNDAAGG
ncbi:hypothetical protein [Actinokineospora enzanensis]|uniref:hypothetical protein n=1 Tax=Actinokineospora enzanensis TaxID=155975 RepID=UPI00036C1133|nr:hypothetical protein [Actinokineospora enzanensis]